MLHEHVIAPLGLGILPRKGAAQRPAGFAAQGAALPRLQIISRNEANTCKLFLLLKIELTKYISPLTCVLFLT